MATAQPSFTDVKVYRRQANPPFSNMVTDATSDGMDVTAKPMEYSDGSFKLTLFITGTVSAPLNPLQEATEYWVTGMSGGQLITQVVGCREATQPLRGKQDVTLVVLAKPE
ncbi:hypothetical protein [Streptomyces sp. 900105245]